LLELHPQFDPDAITFTLQSASGNERKTTGSYYTPTSLITCLLDSALQPVLDEAASKPEAEAAILSLKVCDPACGSGHFLIAAAHRIAKKLAAVRTLEAEPPPDAIQHALRDVIGRCIFGVDINPMAVELCQVALWMDALEPGKPLSFLDHHIQCGNSLLGATPALLANGIPDEAFEPIEGDEKKFCSALKRQNRDERRGQEGLFDDLKPWEQLGNLPAAMARLESIPDDTVEQVHQKERHYADLQTDDAYRKSGRFLADAWCAAFVWRKAKDVEFLPMTHSRFRKIERNPYDIGPHEYTEVRRLAEQYQFFHWHFAFPGVFRYPAKAELPDSELTGWCGGFDVILGNPPWEHTELKEIEWFNAHGRPDIAGARTAAIRGKLILELERADPALYRAFVSDRRFSDGESHLIRNSSGSDDRSKHRWGLFPLCGRGRINTYAIFAELNRNLVRPTGRVGCIVPSGIATDDTTKLFFQELAGSRSLASLFSFFEIRLIFPDTDSRNPFCLLTLTGSQIPASTTEFAFDARSVEGLSDPAKRFTLSSDDLALLNPNTGTCPVFRTARDAEVTKAIYRRVPIFFKEGLPEINAWGVSFKQGLFNMAADSGFFHTASDLDGDGWRLEGNIFRKGDAEYLPLYEAKMLHQFDHRWATYENSDSREVTLAEKEDQTFLVQPRYWVPAEEVADRLKDRWSRSWLLTWRDICRNNDTRTFISSVAPRSAAGATALVMLLKGDFIDKAPLLIANLNSFVLDYTSRQKLGGTHLTMFVVKQLPVLPPTRFDAPTPWVPTQTLAKWIATRVLELVYTSWDLKPFAEDCGYHGDPFHWDDDRRFHLRCELDAAFFQLYAVGETDTAYILDTFPHVRKADEETYGTYRTKETILRLYREFAAPQITQAQYDMLKAMAYVAAFVHAWNKRVETGILETGLVLMVNDALRKAYLTNMALPGRQVGRRHPKLLDWMPLAIDQLLKTNAIKIDPNSPEGLPFYLPGPSPFDLTNLGGYVQKAQDAVKVIKQIGEQKARTEVEENVDDPTQLIPV
jgi:hypothetical protein